MRRVSAAAHTVAAAVKRLRNLKAVIAFERWGYACQLQSHPPCKLWLLLTLLATLWLWWRWCLSRCRWKEQADMRAHHRMLLQRGCDLVAKMRRCIAFRRWRLRALEWACAKRIQVAWMRRVRWLRARDIQVWCGCCTQLAAVALRRGGAKHAHVSLCVHVWLVCVCACGCIRECGEGVKVASELDGECSSLFGLALVTFAGRGCGVDGLCRLVLLLSFR